MSDKPLDVYVLYATDADQKFIKVANDGCLAIFDDEASAKRAKRRHPGTDYKQVNYYSQKQVDRLKAENEELRGALDLIRQIAQHPPVDAAVLRLASAALRGVDLRDENNRAAELERQSEGGE